MDTWRLFLNPANPVTTATGLAVDDTLPLSVEQNGSCPILHLYSFVPSAIVGKYQDIEAALDVEQCRLRDIEFNRRSTGGGTVIMGPDVVALGLGINADYPGLSGGIGGLFNRVAGVLIKALEHVGLRASFRTRNDIEINGKKIAGLSAAAEAGRSLLFHTSLLVDFDMSLMLDIMKTPLIKLRDKGYNCFSQRMTTVNRERGEHVPLVEMMAAIRASFEETFFIRFREEHPDEWEQECINRLSRERYSDRDWIFSHRHPRSRMGVSRVKTHGGLIEVYLSLAGGSIEHIAITGDFFSTSNAITCLENTLRWVPCREDSIREHLEHVWVHDMIYGLDVTTLMQAILEAKKNQVRL